MHYGCIGRRIRAHIDSEEKQELGADEGTDGKPRGGDHQRHRLGGETGGIGSSEGGVVGIETISVIKKEDSMILLMDQTRIVVPQTMRKRLMDREHLAHPGVNNMQNSLRAK